MARIVCVKCDGVGWSSEAELRLKCLLCDVEGFADLQDSLDYYTYMNSDKLKLKMLYEKRTISKTIDEA